MTNITSTLKKGFLLSLGLSVVFAVISLYTFGHVTDGNGWHMDPFPNSCVGGPSLLDPFDLIKKDESKILTTTDFTDFACASGMDGIPPTTSFVLMLDALIASVLSTMVFFSAGIFWWIFSKVKKQKDTTI